MKNTSGLIPIGNNPERDKEVCRKGALATAEKKRQRKSLKEDLLAMLQTELKNDKTVQENWMLALAKKIMTGDVSASVFVRDTIGEKPAENIKAEFSSENKELMQKYLNEVKK